MMRFIYIILGLAILGFIFLRKYLIAEKGVSLGGLFFRKRNIFHHEPDDQTFELTAEEIIPAQKKDLDPRDLAKADSFIKKAAIFAERGDLMGAEKFLIQTLALDPSSVEAYKRLGLLYLTQSQFSKAESIYRKLVATVTDDPVFFSNLGMALFSQQKMEEAKSYYKKAIELDSLRPGRFFSMARILFELKEYDEALKNFQQAITMDPGNLDYLLTLAHFYIDRDMPHEGRELLGEILIAFPQSEDAREMLEKLALDSRGEGNMAILKDADDQLTELRDK